MIQQHLPTHELWRESTAGTPKVLTASYVASEGAASLSVEPYSVINLSAILAGSAVTSLELLIETSLDGTNWNALKSEAVSPTLVTWTVGELSIVLDGSGRIPGGEVYLGACVRVRVSAKRTGGDGTSTLLLLATGGSLR